MANNLIAIVRIRGKISVNVDIESTMEYLRLNRVNHCTLYPDTPVLRGMLYKAKDYLTWGEINSETLKTLLESRARLVSDQKITDEWLKKHKLDFDKLAKMYTENDKKLSDLEIKKVFRLSPPSKGHGKKGIRAIFSQGGSLGDRKEKINDLLVKMI